MGALVSIVTPTRNSARFVNSHYREVSAALRDRGLDYQIIYIDDGSTDDTAALINLICQSDPKVEGFMLSRSFGQQTAISVGYLASKGDVQISLDVDLEVPARVLPDLADLVMGGVEYVAVHRVTRSSKGALRSIASGLFNGYMRWRTDLPIRDFGCGTGAHSAKLNVRMCESEISHCGLKHLAGQLAHSIDNFPVEAEALEGNQSSYDLRSLVRALFIEHRATTGLPLPPESEILSIRQSIPGDRKTELGGNS